MNKRELKRDYLLDAGLTVMATRGYNGTSIQDIVDAASLPKGSFYTYFKSKEDFAIAALEKVASERTQASRKLLNEREIPPLQRLVNFFQASLKGCDESVHGGCFIGNMCQEMSESNEAIRLKVRQMLRNKTLLVEDVLEEARLDGSLKTPIAPAILAEFLFNAWEGAVMRAKASKTREPLDNFLATLAGILGG